MHTMSVAPRARRAALATLCSLAAAPALLVAGVSAAATRGSGNRASEMRTVAEFQAVAVSGAMDLLVRQGAQQSVQLQADDNLLPLIETVVESGNGGPTLKVRWKQGESTSSRSKVQVTVVVPRLTALALAGAGDVRMETFTTPTLQLTLSGSGDARLDGLSTDELGVRISGSGNFGGKGAAAKVRVNIAGSGDVNMLELRADDVQVSIAGSGNAAVDAQKSLQISIAGSGDVVYTGNPQVKSSVAGSGSVRRK